MRYKIISQKHYSSVIAFFMAIGLVMISLGNASAGTNVPQRYVILAAGINSSTGSIDSDLGDIREDLRTAFGVNHFVNFSYHAAVALQRGELYCIGWGSVGCSRGDGNLPSLDLRAIYDASDTQISIDKQADAMNYLVGQIVRQNPSANIDIIGFSLGGIVAARYGAKYSSNSHIHAIITLESPLGGIFGAKSVIDGNPIMKLIFKEGFHFDTEVIRSLQVPGNGVAGSVIASLPQAALNYPFTAIGSTTDYAVNGTAMPLDFGKIEWWKQVLLSFPGRQNVPIGTGAQNWTVPFTRHYNNNLGGSLLNNPISPYNVMDNLNHGIATHSGPAKQWVRDAVSANSYVPDPPPNTTSITINDESNDFHRFGPSRYWQHDGNGENGGSTKTNSASRWLGSGYNNYAEWVPNIPSQGNYEIKVHIPNYPTADNVYYEVYGCGNNRTNVNVNQTANRGQWVSLGTFCLPQGHAVTEAHVGGKIILTDVNTGAPNLGKMVAWDTAQFVRR